MVSKTILALALSLSLVISGLAQSCTTTKNAPEKSKAGYDEALKLLNATQYDKALAATEKALKASPDFIDAYILKGGIYFEQQKWADAETAFEKAISIKPDYDPRVFASLAYSEWYQDKYKEAETHAQGFLAAGKGDPAFVYRVRRLYENAQFAAEAIKKPVPFQLNNLGDAINTAVEEYLPSLTADGHTLVFTRRDGGRDENFYLSEKSGDTWKPAIYLEDINTDRNEGAQNISADGKIVVFAADRPDPEASGGLDLWYASSGGGNKWTKPRPFGNTVNSRHWDTQPCLSADGNTLYFVSDRPGGKGGADIWYSRRGKSGAWENPINIGEPINTPGEEKAPFLHADGVTMYFPSDGHPGMGGLDLYLATKKADNTWSEPKNLGYPINTKDDESTMTVSLDGKIAYCAAYKNDGQGKYDLYRFELTPENQPTSATYVRAIVTDAITQTPIQAQVIISDWKTGRAISTINTRKDGTFLLCLPLGTQYALEVNKKSYLFYSDHFNLAQSTLPDKPYELKIALQPIRETAASTTTTNSTPAVGTPVVLRNVLFQTGSAELLPESTAELKRLTEMLQANPTLRIQINGHTDNVGNEATNMTLSQARANAVMQYLLQQQIAADRLRAKGFGKNQPIATNDTEDGRALNRRTEFEVW